MAVYALCICRSSGSHDNDKTTQGKVNRREKDKGINTTSREWYVPCQVDRGHIRGRWYFSRHFPEERKIKRPGIRDRDRTMWNFPGRWVCRSRSSESCGRAERMVHANEDRNGSKGGKRSRKRECERAPRAKYTVCTKVWRVQSGSKRYDYNQKTNE